MRFLPNRSGMSVERANRLLGAIILLGIFATFFIGDIALKSASFIGGSLVMYWLFVNCAYDLRSSFRQRTWGTFFMAALGYGISLSVIITFLAMVLGSILR